MRANDLKNIEQVRRTLRAVFLEDPWLASIELSVPEKASRLSRYVLEWVDQGREKTFTVFDHHERWTANKLPDWALSEATFQVTPNYDPRQLIRWVIRLCKKVKGSNGRLFEESGLDKALCCLVVYSKTLSRASINNPGIYFDSYKARRDWLLFTNLASPLRSSKIPLNRFAKADKKSVLQKLNKALWAEYQALQICGAWSFEIIAASKLLAEAEDIADICWRGIGSEITLELDFSLIGETCAQVGMDFDFSVACLACARLMHKSAEWYVSRAQQSLSVSEYHRILHEAYLSYQCALRYYKEAERKSILNRSHGHEIAEGWRLCEEARVEIDITFKIAARILRTPEWYAVSGDPHHVERWATWAATTLDKRTTSSAAQALRIKMRMPDFIRDSMVFCSRLIKNNEDVEAANAMVHIAEKLKPRLALNMFLGDYNYYSWIYAFLYSIGVSGVSASTLQRYNYLSRPQATAEIVHEQVDEVETQIRSWLSGPPADYFD